MRPTKLEKAAIKGSTAAVVRFIRQTTLDTMPAGVIEQGIRSTRMDVRAMGNKFEEEPADRVDVVVADR